MRKFLLLFLFTLNSFFCQQSAWKISDQMPHPVAGAESLVWGNEIYIIGGYSFDTQDNVKWIQSFDVVTNEWGDYKNMKYARYGLNAAIKNDTVYCYGGVWDSSYSNSSVEKWDISFSSSSSVFDHQKNFNRIFSAGVIVGDNYYIIGGNPYLDLDSSWFPYIVEYNTLTKSITFELEDSTFGEELPEQQMSAVIGDDIYLFGGVMNGLPSKKIYKFNTVTHEFNILQTELYESRAGGVAVKGSGDNEIYLIGGYHEQSAALSTVEIFTVNGEYFSILPAQDIAIPRKQLMAENIGDVIYLFGGLDENGDWVEEIEIFNTVVSSSEYLDYKELNFSLDQNYPNPFNPTTKIKYTVADNVISTAVRNLGNFSSSSNSRNDKSEVTLKVYDLLGNEITTLVNENKQPGNYTAEFNGDELANGVYFYKLTVNSSSAGANNSFSETKKMVLLK